MTSLSLYDELRFADFPGDLDKYELRKWLIGDAVLRGCTYEGDGGLKGEIIRGDERVIVEVVSGGVLLGVEDLITTKW